MLSTSCFVGKAQRFWPPMKPIRRCTLLKPPKVAVLSSRDLSASAEVRSVACTRAVSLTAPAQRLTFLEKGRRTVAAAPDVQAPQYRNVISLSAVIFF